jgi:hypothetical protein
MSIPLFFACIANFYQFLAPCIVNDTQRNRYFITTPFRLFQVISVLFLTYILVITENLNFISKPQALDMGHLSFYKFFYYFRFYFSAYSHGTYDSSFR